MTTSLSSHAVASQQVRELFQRAVMHIRATHLIEAAHCLDELLHIDPHHADALACRGWIHAMHRQPRLARTDLEAALRHAPLGWPRRAEVEAQLSIEGELDDSRDGDSTDRDDSLPMIA
jgi:regulator of sirC expression with transglutaminase-like and TPR domain